MAFAVAIGENRPFSDVLQMKCSVVRVTFKYLIAFLIIAFGPDDVLKQNDVYVLLKRG
jgi:hypothetical protein